jgi:hypothetical protein
MAVDNATRYNRHIPSLEVLNKGSLIGYNTDKTMPCLAQEIRSRSII